MSGTEYNGNCYAFNPTNCSQQIGLIVVQPKRYAVFPKDKVAHAKACRTPIVFEDHPQFPHPFTVCIPGGTL